MQQSPSKVTHLCYFGQLILGWDVHPEAGQQQAGLEKEGRMGSRTHTDSYDPDINFAATNSEF